MVQVVSTLKAGKRSFRVYKGLLCNTLDFTIVAYAAEFICVRSRIYYAPCWMQLPTSCWGCQTRAANFQPLQTSMDFSTSNHIPKSSSVTRTTMATRSSSACRRSTTRRKRGMAALHRGERRRRSSRESSREGGSEFVLLLPIACSYLILAARATQMLNAMSWPKRPLLTVNQQIEVCPPLWSWAKK